MGNIISLANLKGGVGKTASTISLAGELVEKDARVLIVDTDAQSGATISCGFDPGELSPTLSECIQGNASAEEAIVSTEWGVDLLPARLSLAFSALRIALGEGRTEQTYGDIRNVIRPLREDYDVVLADTPPSAGVLLVGALAASDFVIVPVDCKPLALRGLRLMNQSLRLIKSRVNPDLELLGILPTMYRKRTLLSDEIVSGLKQVMEGKTKIFPPVKHSVRFSELPRTGGPIRRYAPELSGPYSELAEEVLAHV